MGAGMTTRTIRGWTLAAAIATLGVAFATTVSTHHSFAMYDQSKTVTLTGVVKQFVPQANHAEIHFYPLAADHKGLEMKNGKPVEWGIEMAGTAQLERQGITPSSFAQGTVFSARLNPLRDGTNFGSSRGAIAKCPADEATKKPKLPDPGKHCDSVPGHTLFAGKTF
jgi:hypothetical protein